jgi:hypothetical protein
MNIETRIEGKRGCGYRKEGGLYLVLPDFGAKPCGKLPLLLESCPCCGAGVKYSRGWTWINGKLLFGDGVCDPKDPYQNTSCIGCVLSNPPEKMGPLWIGEQFYKTPEDWIKEGQKMGISRRIKSIPHGFKLGETWIAVAHIEAIPGKIVVKVPDLPPPSNGGKKIKEKREKGRPAIFQVFRPSAIEYVVKEGDTEDKLVDLEKRGITLVKVTHLQEQKNLFDPKS